MVEDGFGRAATACERMRGGIAKEEGIDCAAADVGDREAVRAGVDGYRAVHQWRGVVRRKYREHAGEADSARADFEYCVVELSDLGADARGAGAGAGGERDDFEDADGRRVVRTDAGARGGEEMRAAGFTGERVRRAVERSAGAERVRGLPG